MPERKFEQYLDVPPAGALSMANYMACPAAAFLKSVCEAHDAFEHCMNKFTTRKNGSFNKDSIDSLHHIGVALVATVMGHFETYQKGLFAGLLERSHRFKAFEVNKVASALKNPVIDLTRFFSYRGASAPVGQTIADSLGSWYSPQHVNGYFKALGLQRDAFSHAHQSDLTVLWQLRHSIVHTAGWLTLPDAQKVDRLRRHGDRGVAFQSTFVSAMARKLHKIVKAANGQLLDGAIIAIGANADAEVVGELTDFLDVRSPKPVWL